MKRKRRPWNRSQWSQIDYGEQLEDRLQLPPSLWTAMSRVEARDRIVALLALVEIEKCPQAWNNLADLV